MYTCRADQFFKGENEGWLNANFSPIISLTPAVCDAVLPPTSINHCIYPGSHWFFAILHCKIKEKIIYNAC